MAVMAAMATTVQNNNGYNIQATGLKPAYPSDYACSPLTSLYASWIDVDGGRRRYPHSGVDGGRLGEAVLSPAPGKVRAAWRSNWGWGWEGSILIEHTRENIGFKRGAPFYYSVFVHLDYEDIKNLKVGQQLKRGQPLGRVSRPGGNPDYLPEVHWEIWEADASRLGWWINEHGGRAWYNYTARLVDPMAMLQTASGKPLSSTKVPIVPHEACRARGNCRGFTYFLPCLPKTRN